LAVVLVIVAAAVVVVGWCCGYGFGCLAAQNHYYVLCIQALVPKNHLSFTSRLLAKSHYPCKYIQARGQESSFL